MNTNHTLRATAACVAASVWLAAGCAGMSERERGTAQGAGLGALAGAVLGSVTGGNAGTGAVLGGVAGAVAGNVWSKRQEDRRVALEQATRGTGVEVSRTADNQLKLNIPNDVSFDTNSAAIRPGLRGVLDPFARQLNDDSLARISIVGHTDNTGPASVNNPLSVDRADSVRAYLVSRGVPASHVQTSGRGEQEPVADNATDAGRARNRRVEIYLREPAV
ncbi:outer membrane protein/peptidoglycan-associated (lipo)protein [Burkholderiales bacterium JOSHI_001]|nr:outer membrane protein/peptidoglycan-associated (lipo)protein [Burkholderiales bacterium JOSHI_001]